MKIDIGAIEREVAKVRRINVVPVHIHMRSETYAQLVVAILPEFMWSRSGVLSLCGLPVMVTEEGLDGRDYSVCLIVQLEGPCADARRGAE